eukprot:TRINITY_DN1029_c0_g1_i1.p1 TRINITY_DN1029_c0_g1~~TRINITY_DN1029_c0_g1_i1.p1  ORF type:complete len:284 (-),score=61.46 TRINITY_DN1029_c0_g1_i1:9-860(-)
MLLWKYSSFKLSHKEFTNLTRNVAPVALRRGGLGLLGNGSGQRYFNEGYQGQPRRGGPPPQYGQPQQGWVDYNQQGQAMGSQQYQQPPQPNYRQAPPQQQYQNAPYQNAPPPEGAVEGEAVPQKGPAGAVLGIYRPNEKPEFGSAFQFLFRHVDKVVLINASKQKGERLPIGTSGNQFDWENKIVFKLPLMDQAKILAFLQKKSEKVELIHSLQTQKGRQTSYLLMEPVPNKEKAYRMKLTRSRKGTEEQPTNDTVFIHYDDNEAILMQEFLSESIRRGLGFK